MTYEYDFQMVKRAYAEMARRAREKDSARRPPRDAGSPGRPPEAAADSSQIAAEAR